MKKLTRKKKLVRGLSVAAVTGVLLSTSLTLPPLNDTPLARSVGIEIPVESAEAATWGGTCYFLHEGFVGPYKVGAWAEYRHVLVWGLQGGCQRTGYVKYQYGQPTSPWYDYWGTRIR